MNARKALLSLLLAVATAAPSTALAEPSLLPPGASPQLVLDPDVDAALRRARAERIAGITFLAVAGLGAIATIAAGVGSATCDTTPSHDSDCTIALTAYAFLGGIITLAAAGIGTPLLVTGVVRARDVTRLRVTPTASRQGGGLSLAFDF